MVTAETVTFHTCLVYWNACTLIYNQSTMSHNYFQYWDVIFAKNGELVLTIQYLVHILHEFRGIHLHWILVKPNVLPSKIVEPQLNTHALHFHCNSIGSWSNVKWTLFHVNGKSIIIFYDRAWCPHMSQKLYYCTKF